MKKCFLSIAVCLLAAIHGNAQTAAKSIFAEIGGPGLASINFDTRFTKTNGGLGGRIGVGGFSLEGFSIVTVPVAVNYLLSKDDHNFFELGGGITYVNSSDGGNNDDNFSSTFGHISIGYRLQPSAGGFQFRAAITPIFGGFGFLPYWAGISFGYKF